MPKFNQFSEEVHKELMLIKDYGGPEKAPRVADSYKAQALRGVATTLWYEQIESNLKRRLGAAMDIIDCFDVDVDKIVASSFYSKEQAQSLFDRFKS